VRNHPLRHLGFTEALERPGPGGRAQAVAQGRVGGQVRDRPGQGLGVAGWDEQGLAVVAGDLAAAADVGQDHRPAHGRGLDGRAGHALAPGGEHEHVHDGQQVADVVAPAGDDHVLGGRDQLGLADGVGLLQVGGANGQEPDPRVGPAHRPGGGEQLPVALLGHQAAHRPHHHRVGRDAELAAQGRGPLGRDLGRVELADVGAVAEQVAAALAGQPEPGRPAQVLLALVELEVRAAPGQPLGPEHGRPLAQPVLGGGVEAVDGVDDQGHPGRPGRHPAQHPRLGVVGVDQVEALPAQQGHQLGEGLDVGHRVPGPGGVAPGHEPDPLGLQGGPVRPRGADPGDLVALGGQAPQLAQQQVPQGQVGGGQVGDLQPSGHARPQGPRRSIR
jgi:hypothetical protein